MKNLIQIVFYILISSNVFSNSFLIKDGVSILEADENWRGFVSDSYGFNLRSNPDLNDSSRLRRQYYFNYAMSLNSAYRKLSLIEGSNPYSSDKMAVLNETEHSDINGGLHFGIGSYFKDYFSFAMGISFDIFSYSSLPLDSIYLGSDPTTGSIYLSGKYKYQYRLLSIPLEFGVKKELLNSKLIFTASIGVSAGILQEVFYINGHKPSSIPSEAHPIKKMIHFNYYANLGIGFQMSKRLALFYEYSYQRSINKIGVRYQIFQTLWFHEFSLELRYNLFK